MKPTPQLQVLSVRKIYNDGHHNAFTDMCAFKGKVYLTFRSSPTGHDVAADSSIVVLASRDGGDWEKVHSFNVPGRDVRDPHFLVFREQLFIFSGTWLCNGKNDLSEHLGYTEVATAFQPPSPVTRFK
jgi:hypothetical protein